MGVNPSFIPRGTDVETSTPTLIYRPCAQLILLHRSLILINNCERLHIIYKRTEKQLGWTGVFRLGLNKLVRTPNPFLLVGAIHTDVVGADKQPIRKIWS